MFNMIFFLDLLTVKASSPEMCTNACGSIANSRNPMGDMNNLLTSGSNCSSGQYYPLAPQQPYGGGNDACMPSYYPQTGQSSNYGYPSGQQYGPGPNVSPIPFPGNQNDSECEITTSVECKPRKNGGQPQTQQPSMYPGMPSVMQPNKSANGNGSQTCDCSQPMSPYTYPQGQTGGVTSPYTTGSQMMGGGNDGFCDCSQLYNQQQQTGPIQPSVSPQSPYSQPRPAFCNTTSNVLNGRQPINTAIMNAFDCSRPSQYSLPPVRSAIVGTTELPISDNFRVTPSSCSGNNAPCY